MAMERYTETKKIQFSCTAILYYIVLYNINADMNLKVKRKVLSTLLNIMYAHRHDTVVVRNGCLTLSRFELPHDVVIHTVFTGIIPPTRIKPHTRIIAQSKIICRNYAPYSNYGP